MKQSKNTKNIARILLIVITFAFCFIVNPLKQPNQAVTAEVITTSLGVYWDINCTQQVQSINWGSFSPGSSKNIIVYVRNEGQEDTHLYLDTSDWQPTAARKFFSLIWNYAGKSLVPNMVIPIRLELSLSSRIEGITSFSFNIIVSSADATVNLMMLLDQEGYVALDIWCDTYSEFAAGVKTCTINLSVSEGISVVRSSGGEYPFNSMPSIQKSAGQIIITTSPSDPQYQMTGLSIARLWLRLSGSVKTECVILPVSFVITDSNGVKHDLSFYGKPIKFLRGDANNDQRVSVADAMIIAQYLAGTRSAYDLNLLNVASVRTNGENGDKITVADAMFIAQYLVGQRDEYFQVKS
jgi:hypothetical protein